MKNLFIRQLGLLVSLVLLVGQAGAQAPPWQTAMALTGATTCLVESTDVDSSGAVVIAGWFIGTLRLGAATMSTPGGSPYPDGFVAKWHPVTGFVWAKKISVSGFPGINLSAVVASGNNVYVAGSFSARSTTLLFDNISVAGPCATGGMCGRIGFVAKLADAGSTSTWQWAQTAGPAQAAGSPVLAVSGTSVYVGTSGGGPSGTPSEGVVSKFRDAGSTAGVVWEQYVTGSESETVDALVVHGNDVYVAGAFQSSPTTFSPIYRTTGILPLTTSGLRDVYVAKLTDAGGSSSWQWAQRAGGATDEYASALAVHDSSIYVGGSFTSATALFGTTTLTNQGSADTYVAKLTDTGSASRWRWAQPVGGSANDYVSSLGVQDSGIYVAGVFASPTATFGPTTLTNMGGSDFFVSKLTDAGSTSNWQWAKATGGSGNDRSDALAVRGNRVYVVGSFTSPTILFNTSLVNATSATVGYLASLVDFPLAAPADLPGVRFILFPNPAHHTATLTGATAPTATLLDGVGRVVRTVPVTQGAATLDVRGLPAGLYTVRAGGRARRLVVE